MEVIIQDIDRRTGFVKDNASFCIGDRDNMTEFLYKILYRINDTKKNGKEERRFKNFTSKVSTSIVSNISSYNYIKKIVIEASSTDFYYGFCYIYIKYFISDTSFIVCALLYLLDVFEVQLSFLGGKNQIETVESSCKYNNGYSITKTYYGVELSIKVKGGTDIDIDLLHKFMNTDFIISEIIISENKTYDTEYTKDFCIDGIWIINKDLNKNTHRLNYKAI